MNQNSREPEKKRDHTKTQIVFSSILLLLDMGIELYTMINAPTNIIALGVFGILAIVFLYVLILGILQAGYVKEEERLEQYDNLFKSEKASYLLLRKSFDDLQARFDKLERVVKVPTDEIINAQKAVAKITINRSKENADAVLNGNDLIMETLSDLQNQITQINNEIQANQKNVSSKNSQDILMKQQEVLTNLKDMQVQLQRDIMNAMSRVAQAPTPVVMQAPIMTQPVAQAVAQPEVVAPSMDMTEVPVMTETIVEEPMMETVEETVAEEPVMEAVEETVAEEPVMEAVEETVAEEPAMEAVEEAVAEEPVMETVEEAVAEEPAMEVVEEAVAEEPAMEVVEEAVAEEPVVEAVEEKPEMPDLSDPGHVMTPEEIAAMIANADKVMDLDAPVFEESTEESRKEAPVDENGLTDLEKAVEAEIAKMNGEDEATVQAVAEEMNLDDEIVAQEIEETPVEEAVVEEVAPPPEPVVEEAPAEEEKPPMPDLSDPNKVMTPEEIAALIANM